MDNVLHAIAEPHRRAILDLVRTDELPAGVIAAQFAVSRSAISQHLRVLIEAGLVTVRREGTHRYYRARTEGLRDLRQYLDRFWDDQLGELKVAAETEQRAIDGARAARPSRANAPKEPTDA